MLEMDDVTLLARLMAFAPVSSTSNRPIAEFAAAHMQRSGATVQILPSTNGEQFNVVARIGPEAPDRGGLLLSGHLDVVPADEPQWIGDAFTLREDAGNLYGRGSCDMLGSVALFINLFRDVDADRLAAPLAVVLTFGEELGSLGAKRLVEMWDWENQLPRACVVGEPTSLRVVRMHKGHLKMRIVVTGKAAHSGSPHLGSNAIESATPVLVGLSELRQALERERPRNGEYFDAVPFVALNVARVQAGSALNVIPEECLIEIGLRPLPGMDGQELVDRVKRAVTGADATGGAIVSVIDDNPPMLTSADAPICVLFDELTGQTKTFGVSYSSDGGVFGRDLCMDCVLFGPGSIEHAHRPNEFVPIAELQQAREILQKVIEAMCVQRVRAT